MPYIPSHKKNIGFSKRQAKTSIESKKPQRNDVPPRAYDFVKKKNEEEEDFENLQELSAEAIKEFSVDLKEKTSFDANEDDEIQELTPEIAEGLLKNTVERRELTPRIPNRMPERHKSQKRGVDTSGIPELTEELASSLKNSSVSATGQNKKASLSNFERLEKEAKNLTIKNELYNACASHLSTQLEDEDPGTTKKVSQDYVKLAIDFSDGKILRPENYTNLKREYIKSLQDQKHGIHKQSMLITTASFIKENGHEKHLSDKYVLLKARSALYLV